MFLPLGCGLVAPGKADGENGCPGNERPSHEASGVSALTSPLLTGALLDAGGSLSEAGVGSAARPGAFGSAGDAEEIPPAGLWTAHLRGRQLQDWTRTVSQDHTEDKLLVSPRF